MKNAGAKEEATSLDAGFRTGLEAQHRYSVFALGDHSLALVWGLVRPRPCFFGLSMQPHWTIIWFWSSAPGGEKKNGISLWVLETWWNPEDILLAILPFLCPCPAMYPMGLLPWLQPHCSCFQGFSGIWLFVKVGFSLWQSSAFSSSPKSVSEIKLFHAYEYLARGHDFKLDFFLRAIVQDRCSSSLRSGAIEQLRAHILEWLCWSSTPRPANWK